MVGKDMIYFVSSFAARSDFLGIRKVPRGRRESLPELRQHPLYKNKNITDVIVAKIPYALRWKGELCVLLQVQPFFRQSP